MYGNICTEQRNQLARTDEEVSAQLGKRLSAIASIEGSSLSVLEVQCNPNLLIPKENSTLLPFSF